MELADKVVIVTGGSSRKEFAPDGIVVSLVYPAVTATEFHQTLRAGVIAGRGGPFQPLTSEEVAEAIIGLIHSGDEEAILTPQPGG